MTRTQLLVALTIFYLLATAGVVWMFGPYGLMGAGAVGFAAIGFVNVREE